MTPTHPNAVGNLEVLKAAEAVRVAASSSPSSPARVSQTLVGDPRKVGLPGSRLGIAPGNKGLTYKATPPTTEEAYALLDELSANTTSPKMVKLGRRNRSLVAFIWRTGARIHEALLARPRDVDFDNHQIHIPRGKGGKERFSVIDDYGLSELQEWLDVRAELGFTDDQPIFCVIEGSTRGGQLNQAYVRTKLHEAAQAISLDKRVVCHQWRHAHALHLHRMKVPLGAISKQLGHSNTATTSTYLSGMSAEEITDYVLGAWEGV